MYSLYCYFDARRPLANKIYTILLAEFVYWTHTHTYNPMNYIYVYIYIYIYIDLGKSPLNNFCLILKEIFGWGIEQIRGIDHSRGHAIVRINTMNYK